MSKTSIEWCDYTFNPWSGCTKVSPGCANCYAETNYSVQVRGVKWGPNGNRIVKAESGWKEPLKWDKAAKAAGERPRVFCASLADVFEDWTGRMLDAQGRVLYWDQDDKTLCATTDENDGEYRNTATMDDFRKRLFNLIDATPNLDWLLLTKRPENFRDMLPDRWLDIRWPENVWLGVSVENQGRATRVAMLCDTPAKVRFVSAEPLLGPLEITGYLSLIHWVIVGGESGPGARPCDIEWIRDIMRQCQAASVPVFIKQLGSQPYIDHSPELAATIARKHGVGPLVAQFLNLHDKKGGDPAEWSDDLRVREFPGDKRKAMP